MSDTLVIHPADTTTDCLKAIYEGRGWDVINDIHTTNKEVMEAIRKHKRLIFLGHGTPEGLLCGDGYWRFARYIIDHTHAFEMRGKDTFSIWCNSDSYFEKFGLHGFHTGMIISETNEEWGVLGRCPLDAAAMASNMERFCKAVAHGIDLSPEECKECVLREYVGDDEVTLFNRDNIIVL